MVCREAQVGSAVTSYVIQTTNLEERQVLSLYHEVMREGRTAEAPSLMQQTAAIGAIRNAVTATTSLSPARRRSIEARLDRARQESMNGQRYYATRRLIERAERAERAMDDFIAHSARNLGITEAEARTRFNNARAAAESDRSVRVTPETAEALRNNASLSGMPLDRSTMAAVNQLLREASERRSTQPSRPSVTREPVQSRAIAEMGYDPTTGRVEVVLRSNPNVPYAYRMTQAEYDAFRNSDSVGSYFATEVRGNDAYRYADSEAADADATQHRCPTCGEFSGTGHACPPRGSTEEINRTTRRAREAARRTNATRRVTPLTAQDEENQAADDAAGIPPRPVRRPARRVLTDTTATTPAEPTRITGSTRWYSGEGAGFRSIGLTDVQSAARRNSGGVIVPVTAGVTHISTENGPRADNGRVEGTVMITYNGRGRGYTVAPSTSPGDTGRDQLRCTCADYRSNYDCVHIRQAVQSISNRINQTALRPQHSIGPAIETVNAELAADRDESVAAQATSRATWSESPVSYTNDHQAFQRDYKAAKDRIAAGQPAVEYMTENATDGLGAPNGGRAFGVELEFDIAPGQDRSTVLRNIGAALRREGLTTTASQQGYHSADRRGYTTNHQGGWSFEADCTVAGEIVSPIMYDTPETWRNLQKVCDIIRDNGGTVTARTGSHVHVSAHNYDHTVENHNRLLGMFSENEDAIYRLSSNPTRGTHRGPQWCAPNRRPSTPYRSVSEAANSNNSHGLGLNLQSVRGRDSDHVEFRTYDASHDPAVIQAQIKMSLAMTEAAFRDHDYQPGTHTPLGSHRAHNRQAHGASRRLTGESWRQDTAGYRAFADRLFRRPEDKAQLTSLFAATKWQRVGRR